MTPIERFLQKIEVDPETGCWLWTGSITGGGYGQLRVGSTKDGTRRYALVHRLAHEWWIGPIPDGFDVDHVRERGCVHRHCACPDHLEAVTRQENLRRGINKESRKTNCPAGHPYDETNTRWYRTHRYCRACDRVRSASRRAA